MCRTLMLICLSATLFYNCNAKKEDRGNGVLSHEDVVSLEESSTLSMELIQYQGVFEGKYFDEPIHLDLEKDGDYIIQYKDKKVEGEWFKKDDGSLMEFDSKKKLPFQFMLWSDNQTIMILNSDGTADENGENYLTRIK